MTHSSSSRITHPLALIELAIVSIARFIVSMPSSLSRVITLPLHSSHPGRAWDPPCGLVPGGQVSTRYPSPGMLLNLHNMKILLALSQSSLGAPIAASLRIKFYKAIMAHGINEKTYRKMLRKTFPPSSHSPGSASPALAPHQ